MGTDDMTKLLLLPITLPMAMAKGAVDGALRAAIDMLDDVASGAAPEGDVEDRGPSDPVAAGAAEPDLAVVPEPAEEAASPPEDVLPAPDEPAEPEPDAVVTEALGAAAAEVEPPIDALPGDDTGFPSEVEPGELLEPATPDDVAIELGLPTEEPTRGEVAELREREREAEATDDSPGAVIHVDEPWDGYRAMSAPDVVDRLRAADDATKAVVLLYEEQHRARRSVLAAARGESTEP